MTPARAAYQKQYKKSGMPAEYMRRKRANETPEKRAARLEYMRWSNISRLYGLSRADFESMIANQGGKCAICHEALTLESMGTHIDHCHASGRIRGLLCRDCNRGLGGFRDCPENLARAIAYLGAGDGSRVDAVEGR